MVAVSLVPDQGFTRREAASSLDINAQMLGRWVKENQSEDGQAFRGNGKLTPEQEENRKLKAQVKRLEMERDILNKATAFFAAETKWSIRSSPNIRMPIQLPCNVRFWVWAVMAIISMRKTRPTSRMILSIKRCWNGLRTSPRVRLYLWQPEDEKSTECAELSCEQEQSKEANAWSECKCPSTQEI